MRKRLLSGMREVAKAVKLRKAHSVVVVPNVEAISSQGGLDERMQGILDLARENSVPVVFALSLKKLGQVFGQRKKMSAVALLDVNGAHDLARLMLQMAAAGREDWVAVQANKARGTPTASIAASGSPSASNTGTAGGGDQAEDSTHLGATSPSHRRCDSTSNNPSGVREGLPQQGRPGQAKENKAGPEITRTQSSTGLNPSALAFVPSWLPQ